MIFTLPTLLVMFSVKVGCLHKNTLCTSLCSPRGAKRLSPSLSFSEACSVLPCSAAFWKGKWWVGGETGQDIESMSHLLKQGYVVPLRLKPMWCRMIWLAQWGLMRRVQGGGSETRLPRGWARRAFSWLLSSVTPRNSYHSGNRDAKMAIVSHAQR